MKSALRIGAFHGDVTPCNSGPLAGYIARNGARATGTLDPLESTVVLIDDGSTHVCLVTLDAVAVTAELTNQIAAAIRSALDEKLSVHVAASHTHSGPAHWLGTFAPGHIAELDNEARNDLVQRLVSIAITAAKRRERAASIGWSEPVIEGLAATRSVRSDSTPITAGVLVVDNEDDERIVLVDVPCHATVLGPDSLQWSADWPGALRRSLRRQWPGAEIAFLNGACGDLSTRFTRREATAAEADRLGRLAALSILASTPHTQPPSVSLDLFDAHIVLPRREVDEAAAQQHLDETERAGAADPIARSLADGAKVELAVARASVGKSDEISVPVTVLQMGGTTWLMTPLELFSSTADALSRRIPRLRLIGCVDDYLGYLPDAAAFDAATYEARTALFGPDAETQFQDRVQGILQNKRSEET